MTDGTSKWDVFQNHIREVEASVVEFMRQGQKFETNVLVFLLSKTRPPPIDTEECVTLESPAVVDVDQGQLFNLWENVLKPGIVTAGLLTFAIFLTSNLRLALSSSHELWLYFWLFVGSSIFFFLLQVLLWTIWKNRNASSPEPTIDTANMEIPQIPNLNIENPKPQSNEALRYLTKLGDQIPVPSIQLFSIHDNSTDDASITQVSKSNTSQKSTDSIETQVIKSPPSWRSLEGSDSAKLHNLRSQSSLKDAEKDTSGLQNLDAQEIELLIPEQSNISIILQNEIQSRSDDAIVDKTRSDMSHPSLELVFKSSNYEADILQDDILLNDVQTGSRSNPGSMRKVKLADLVAEPSATVSLSIISSITEANTSTSSSSNDEHSKHQT
ncbi:uncharacterized protein LOC118434578 [Folsomia candida]|uniref:uncharacterized protein LOC118434578 n=1 Tax=Folsomia candida TaxID=158441 RepID=UPI001604DB76|nr:uncharacterized protein LOC118434578 [Folsomia candida]